MHLLSDLYSFLSRNNNVYVSAPIIRAKRSLILQATSADCPTPSWIKRSKPLGRVRLMDALRRRDITHKRGGFQKDLWNLTSPCWVQTFTACVPDVKLTVSIKTGASAGAAMFPCKMNRSISFLTNSNQIHFHRKKRDKKEWKLLQRTGCNFLHLFCATFGESPGRYLQMPIAKKKVKNYFLHKTWRPRRFTPLINVVDANHSVITGGEKPSLHFSILWFCNNLVQSLW